MKPCSIALPSLNTVEYMCGVTSFSVIICKYLFLPHLLSPSFIRKVISIILFEMTSFIHHVLTFAIPELKSHVIHGSFYSSPPLYNNSTWRILYQPALTSQWSSPAFDLDKSNLFHLQPFHVVMALYVLGERTNTEAV